MLLIRRQHTLLRRSPYAAIFPHVMMSLLLTLPLYYTLYAAGTL